MVTAMEELEFTVVCILWHADDLTLPWIHMRTWAQAFDRLNIVGKIVTQLSYLLSIVRASTTQQKQHASIYAASSSQCLRGDSLLSLLLRHSPKWCSEKSSCWSKHVICTLAVAAIITKDKVLP